MEIDKDLYDIDEIKSIYQDFDIPDEFGCCYRELCRQILTLLFVPGMKNKFFIHSIYHFYDTTFALDLMQLSTCYNGSLYRDNLLNYAKEIFYFELKIIRDDLEEYYNIKLDISNIKFEDYAIGIESIIGLENAEYWKTIIANHLDDKELIDFLYTL